MKCLRCGHKESKVLESRFSDGHKSVRRRRVCTKCSHRYTTFEREENILFLIKKKQGHIELYQREKATRSIQIACQKRNISINQIEFLLGQVESSIRDLGEKIVTSRLLGDLLIKKLYHLDKVAYVRFSSVYKDFKDPQEFATLLKMINKKDPGTKHQKTITT